MSASLFTPWGDVPLLVLGADLNVNGVAISFPPEGAASASGEPAVCVESAAGDDPFASRAEGAPAGRRTSDGLRSEARPVAGNSSVHGLSDDAALFLRLIAAHHRCDMAGAIERAAVHYCETIIGLQRCADMKEQLQGRAEVARLAHNQEVARSNRAPATSITPESEDRGGGGNPAVPASAAGPP